MTHAEILQAVQADSALAALIPDTQAIAAALSVGRAAITERYIGIGTVLDVLGPVNGAALLEQFETLAASDIVVKWGWKLLEKQMLDVGLDSTRQFLQSALPVDAATALLSLAERPDPVSEIDVRRALLADDGTWRV